MVGPDLRTRLLCPLQCTPIPFPFAGHPVEHGILGTFVWKCSGSPPSPAPISVHHCMAFLPVSVKAIDSGIHQYELIPISFKLQMALWLNCWDKVMITSRFRWIQSRRMVWFGISLVCCFHEALKIHFYINWALKHIQYYYNNNIYLHFVSF